MLRSISSPLLSCCISSGDIVGVNGATGVGVDRNVSLGSGVEAGSGAVAGRFDVDAEADADVDADADSADPKTVCMKDAHSSASPRPSILISGVSITGGGANARLPERRGGSVEDRRPSGGVARKFHSGDRERCEREGRMAESSEVERTSENRTPSSPTSSAPPPAPLHSMRLFRSMGVPRPTYFTSGHEPRAVEVPAPGSCFLDAVVWEADVEIDERGDGDDRRELAWGSSETEAGGDGGGERQERSSSKSSKPPNAGTSMTSGRPCTVTSSYSRRGTAVASTWAATMTSRMVVW